MAFSRVVLISLKSYVGNVFRLRQPSLPDETFHANLSQGFVQYSKHKYTTAVTVIGMIRGTSTVVGIGTHFCKKVHTNNLRSTTGPLSDIQVAAAPLC